MSIFCKILHKEIILKRTFLFFLLASFVGLILSACSGEPEPYYDRANAAAKEAHNKLDRE